MGGGERAAGCSRPARRLGSKARCSTGSLRPLLPPHCAQVRGRRHPLEAAGAHVPLLLPGGKLTAAGMERVWSRGGLAVGRALRRRPPPPIAATPDCAAPPQFTADLLAMNHADFIVTSTYQVGCASEQALPQLHGFSCLELLAPTLGAAQLSASLMAITRPHAPARSRPARSDLANPRRRLRGTRRRWGSTRATSHSRCRTCTAWWR